jgi:hypothetical protein
MPTPAEHSAKGVNTLVDGQIRELDPALRRVVLALENGREVTMTVAPDANIEVVEPATLGTMGGTLEDLRVGYWVKAELSEPGVPACSCTSILCVS